MTRLLSWFLVVQGPRILAPEIPEDPECLSRADLKKIKVLCKFSVESPNVRRPLFQKKKLSAIFSWPYFIVTLLHVIYFCEIKSKL